jgi:hypothetical protein
LALAPILLRGSVYPTQQPLAVETALPVMKKGSVEIAQTPFSIIGLIPTSNLKRFHGKLMWSNDADDSLFKTNNENTCSMYLKPDQNPTDK